MIFIDFPRYLMAKKIGFDCMTQWKHALVPNHFQARVILFACFFGDHPFVL